MDQEELDGESEKWRTAIILYVTGNSPSIGAVERFLNSQWKFEQKPQIYYHQEDYFVISFSSMEERDEVMFSEPHTTKNRPVILRLWNQDFNLYDEVLVLYQYGLDYQICR